MNLLKKAKIKGYKSLDFLESRPILRIAKAEYFRENEITVGFEKRRPGEKRE